MKRESIAKFEYALEKQSLDKDMTKIVIDVIGKICSSTPADEAIGVWFLEVLFSSEKFCRIGWV